ncbi:formate dehydrogenase accessory sulfurtransferase FdhD [Akkermansiaceae bacterium]|nr:formate dehydrogenase accessory sulfurtransferase FdhD [Akkermansiaceae bacterium]
MQFKIKQFSKGEWSEKLDDTAAEEPLQITLDGVPIAVVMRTPNSDLELIYGFLITEGILTDLSMISRVDLTDKDNHALVFLKDDVEVDLIKLQRNMYSASSCGICGKASMDSILVHAPSIAEKPSISPEVILSTPNKLREQQDLFNSTGGIHAAGIFHHTGELICVKEDVGRHNAVDKAIGYSLLHEVDLTKCFLQLSGRVSFEVIQKALVAGIPAISAISAPSSLAVEFARKSNITLYGFVRNGKFNQYH